MIYKKPHWHIYIAQQQPIKTGFNPVLQEGNMISTSLVTTVDLLFNNTNIVLDNNIRVCVMAKIKVIMFISISAISWQSVLLVEETAVPGENLWPVTNHWPTSSHNVVSSTSCYERDSNLKRKWWKHMVGYVSVIAATITNATDM